MYSIIFRHSQDMTLLENCRNAVFFLVRIRKTMGTEKLYIQISVYHRSIIQISYMYMYICIFMYRFVPTADQENFDELTNNKRKSIATVVRKNSCLVECVLIRSTTKVLCVKKLIFVTIQALSFQVFLSFEDFFQDCAKVFKGNDVRLVFGRSFYIRGSSRSLIEEIRLFQSKMMSIRKVKSYISELEQMHGFRDSVPVRIMHGS